MNERRYTIFNLYIRGSNQSPQACHGFMELVKKLPTMTPEAAALYNRWANDSMIEIMLQGGYHEELEKMASALSRIPGLPSAKFNESIEALNGACTVVTFVASEQIVQAVNYCRGNRLTPFNAVKKLSEADINDLMISFPLTDDEIQVAASVAFLQFAN